MVALKLRMKVVILVLAVWGQFPAKVVPGTRANGSGSKNDVERTYN